MHGGHNKILSQAQIDAIYKYVEESYLSGYGATKQMVWMAIGCLKAAECPAKPQPQTFIAGHLDLFKTIKTRAIARARVTAADVDSVKK